MLGWCEEGAIELATTSASRFGDAQEPEIRAEVAAATSATQYLNGDYEASLRTLDEQLGLLESLEDLTRLMQTMAIKPAVLGLVGRHREAGMLARGLVETVRQDGDLRQLADSLGAVSLVLAEDDPRKAIEALLEAISVASKGGFGAAARRRWTPSRAC